MRLDEWLRAAALQLEAAGIESARLEAEVLASHVLLVDRTWVITHPEAEFPDLAGEALLQRRLKQEPLAYILGKREFYGRSFLVGYGVLIPRHETEALIDAALEIDRENLRVLDIGTGSGCIGVTLALERPTWQVTASDISPKALEIAQRNAELLDAPVNFVLSDLAEKLFGPFDLIVSNPPYVSRSDDLGAEIRDHEPEVALYAEGNGLDFYRRLSHECANLLEPGGSILMELGAGQSTAVRAIFEEAGWQFTKIWKDLLGVDRVFGFRWSSTG